MIGTLASRVSGLIRNALLNQLFSPTVTDAFNVALKVPNLFRELLAEGALTNSFIPAYKLLPEEEARRLSGALLSWLLLVNALLLLLTVWIAPVIVDILLAGDSRVDRTLTITLTRAAFPFLAAMSFSALAMGILNAHERFFAPAWAPVVLNLVASMLMLVYPENALMLAVGFVLGGAAQLAFQLPVLLHLGLLPRLGLWWHPGLRSVLVLMIPFTFTTGARQFLNVLATRLLSGLPVGSVTAFANADLFLSLALGLFSVSPALAFYSRLSALTKDPAAFVAVLTEGLKLIAFLSVPAGLLLALYADAAVSAVLNWLPLLGRSGMDPQVLQLSVLALAPLGLAVFPMGVGNLLLRTFYVRQKVRTPVVITVISVSLSALLYSVLARRYGIVGLSWSTVIVAWAQLAVLFALVQRREGLDVAAFAHYALKVWLAALVAVSAGWALVLVVPLPGGWLGAALTLALGGTATLVLYAALGSRLGLSEVARLRRRPR